LDLGCVKAPAFTYRYQHPKSAFFQFQQTYSSCFIFNEDGKAVLELSFEKEKGNFFINLFKRPRKGNILLFTDENIELLIYSVFYYFEAVGSSML